MAETYRRYFAGEEAAYEAVGRVVIEANERFRVDDWTGVRGVCADDFAHVNHEVIALDAPTVGADAWVELARTYREATPEVDIELGTILAIAQHGIIARTGILGSLDEDGGAFRHDYVTVTMVGDGRIRPTEFFGPDDLEGAVARFDELVGAEQAASARHPEDRPVRGGVDERGLGRAE